MEICASGVIRLFYSVVAIGYWGVVSHFNAFGVRCLSFARLDFLNAMMKSRQGNRDFRIMYLSLNMVNQYGG